MRAIQCLLASCVLLCTTAAWTMDLHPPPWDLTLPNQTSQAWEVMPSGSLLDIPPTIMDNPFGQPSISIENGELEEVPGPGGAPVLTWHIMEGGGKLRIWVPNNPDPNLYKQIFWQITSDKSPTPTGDPPTTIPGGTALTAPYTSAARKHASVFTGRAKK